MTDAPTSVGKAPAACHPGHARHRRSPRCCRCSTSTGLTSGNFVPALGQFLGSTAGLSAPVITRLTEQWKAEQRAFADRGLSTVDYVYLWAGGVHVNVRLEEHRLCLLVMIGVPADGRKELIALADGYHESAESWADLLRDCQRRGMRAPVPAVGDGGLGFWAALGEVFPQARGRSKVPKGPGSRATGPAMAFKLIESAQARWRALNAPHPVALVRTGTTFINGKLVERPEEVAA